MLVYVAVTSAVFFVVLSSMGEFKIVRDEKYRKGSFFIIFENTIINRLETEWIAYLYCV